MSDRTDVVYIYDGSHEGLLCAIFEAFRRKESPADIQPWDAPQMYLYPSINIETDIAHAERVKRGILRESYQGYELVEACYYSCHPHKEKLILDYVRLVMSKGRAIDHMLTDDTVAEMQRTVKRLTNEMHKYRQFIRFSEVGGVLTAVIDPDNYILQLLAPHFTDRYKNQAFVIYDERHKHALFYQKGDSLIIPVEDFNINEEGEEEKMYQGLWKQFYDAIAIKERYNPRCRMGHMPKKYWKHITEMN